LAQGQVEAVEVLSLSSPFGMAAAVAASVRSTSMPVFGRMKARQLEVLHEIVTKHLEDPAYKDIASADDFAKTTTERGVSHWEHGHLVAALDTLNTYQGERRAKSKMHLLGRRAGMQSMYTRDSRTRFVELLKRWLRNNAGTADLAEDGVRRMSSMCRDIMNHAPLFPARNERSFMKTIAEVYQHLELQLREVLERDRSCAELAQRVLSYSRNLVSDAIGYLLVGPTDLKKTDELPSLEVVSLWASLPSEAHPLPGRIDAKMQRTMRDVWLTDSGTVIARLLQTRWCVSLFEGAGAQEEAAATPRDVSTPEISSLIDSLKNTWGGSCLKTSGLAGCFRKPEQIGVRMDYLAAVQAVADLAYLIGEALVQFHRISDGLGDYGMIRVSTWLHPFLEALTEKVQRLKGLLENLHRAVDDHLVVAKARGYAVEKPAPSQGMGKRAHDAIDRAAIRRSSHVQVLLQAMEELRQRSSPDRLPQVVAGIGDACMQLDAVLSSPQFLACVGDRFPTLPRLCDVALGQSQHQIGFEANLPPQIEDVAESEGTTTTPRALQDSHTPALADSLRSGAALRCDQPDVDFVEPCATASPSFHDGQHGASLEQNGGNAATSSTSKGAQEKANWPLPVQRSALEHEEEAFTLHTTVNRLMPVPCGTGFRRHDRRALRLKAGQLDVFEKASEWKVKTSLCVRRDVEECELLPGHKRLALSIRRLPQGADISCGVWQRKDYIFECDSVHEATGLHEEIARLLKSSA